MRIVSLIASATELVCALGFEESLVGRSHECDFPPSIKRLPVCTRPRFSVEGSSAEIDRRVQETLHNADSVYAVDEPLLERLNPDVIVTQSQCEVCAVSLKDVERAISERPNFRPRVVTLSANRLSDVWEDAARLSQALDVPGRGEALTRAWRGRLEAISDKTRTLPRKPAVGCLEWLEPLMGCGNWIPELVEIAGGKCVLGEAGKLAPRLERENILSAGPEILVALPCGFDLKRARAELDVLAGKPGWPDIKAARNGRVFATDGNQYFNRPGPRLVESAEILAEIFHPEVFRFGHEGSGWERLPRP